MTEKEKMRLDDLLLQIVTLLREKRMETYDFARDIYQNKMEKACAADQMYMKMDLSEEQRSVIDELLELRSDAETCELTITYVAGLLDGIVFLRDVGFLDVYISDDLDADEG